MIQRIRTIYERLGDEESREIFEKRLMFSLTGDRKHIDRIVYETELYQKIRDRMLYDRREKYIVGSGYWGKIIADLFYDYGIAGFLDNHATGTYKGIPIFPMKEFLQSKPEASLYIASTTFHEELCQMLEGIGVEEERVVDVTGMMLQVFHEQQYFDLPCLEKFKESHEVFIDGGCYDGANSIRFAQWAGDVQRTIYAFEADEKNFERCRDVLNQLEGADCHLIAKGMWSKDMVLNFCAKANEASSFTENGSSRMQVTSLDSAVKEKVTFIKMDIEGAEYEALLGAENMIVKYHPKLAISIYHKMEDIWEIPLLLLSFYSGYTFYLRHYSLSSEETVLYAVPTYKEKG